METRSSYWIRKQIRRYQLLPTPLLASFGRYIAFSINRTTQQLHSTQRTEVYDTASDVIVYDVERHTFLSVPGLASQSSFDTFPSFSPDGKSLFLLHCSGLLDA